MQRLTLGIIAVFCVHIAFAALMAIDGSTETALQRIKPGEMTYRVAGSPGDTIVAALKSDDMSAVADTDGQTVIAAAFVHRRQNTIDRPDRREPKGFTAATARYVPQVHKVQKPAKLTPQLPPLPTDRRSDVAAIRKERRPDKRSFFAAALPIVKKPWEWVKAIGSKLR